MDRYEFQSISDDFWLGSAHLQINGSDPETAPLVELEIRTFLDEEYTSGTTQQRVADDILRATTFAHAAHAVAEHFRKIGNEAGRRWYHAAGQDLITRQMNCLELFAVMNGALPGGRVH